MADDEKSGNKLDDLALAKLVQERWKDASDAAKEWLEEARESYDFVAGHQWSDDDKNKLSDEGRPCITFNRVGVIINAVLGIEENQKQETKYLPRENSDTGLAEATDDYTKWARDYADIGAEESAIFEDLAICGMGWGETRMDYEVDLDGKLVQERVDPLEMRWDPAARKRNLVDRRWHIRGRRMDEDEIVTLWPDAELGASITQGPDDSAMPVAIDTNPATRYTGINAAAGSNDDDGLLVLHYQWFESEPVYRAQNPQTGEIRELTSDEFKKVKEVLDAGGAKWVKQTKRVYYQAFVCGNEVLERGQCPSQTGFSFKCATGKKDHMKGSWYGLLRAAKDPQRWSNRFFSQILDIIAANAKGGLIAETGAFVDDKAAEGDWARADSIVFVNKGALAQQRVMPKPVAPYPQGLDRLMAFSINAIRDVLGVNLELLGMADRQQAGVLEETRKRSAYTILATLFASLSAYRKESGLVFLEFINRYTPVNRIEAVLAQDKKQYAEQVKNINLDKIDIIVSEAPQSENNKMLTWAFITQVAPFLVKSGVPVPPEVLDYSPLPVSLAEKWKKMIEGGQGGGQPSPEQAQMAQAGMQMQMAGAQADVQGRQADAAKKGAYAEAAKAKAAKAMVEAMATHEMAGHKLTAEQRDQVMKEVATIMRIQEGQA